MRAPPTLRDRFETALDRILFHCRELERDYHTCLRRGMVPTRDDANAVRRIAEHTAKAIENANASLLLHAEACERASTTPAPTNG